MKNIHELQSIIEGLRSYISSDFCDNPKDVYNEIHILEQKIKEAIESKNSEEGGFKKL